MRWLPSNLVAPPKNVIAHSEGAVELFNLVIGTLLLRPYVFFFLTIALCVSVLLMGRSRTAVFFCATWGIAFASEISSTRIGFPFGDYYYIDTTRDQELWIFNVPFMDSISFSFLLFASYCCANLYWQRLESDCEWFGAWE